jgi:aspartyl-tRNA(Asn)/glutamyl-tRNA(Gln) amidotransferase subunit B
MAVQDSGSAQWEVVIGLETHTQLKTASKIFSGASTAFGAEPNAQASAVDIALPGVLPVLNREAVVCAIKLGLAVGGEIAPRSIFARKNYFYPDLPKGYQISQYEIPVVSGGGLNIHIGQGENATEKFVHLTRAHLEEDAGKSLHEDFQGKTGIDLNRAGTPLLEIVTEPDMRSAEEAVAYAKTLHALVQWIGICDGNMQEGSFRCDANVSVRRPGGPLGTRREIKNLNSFRFMQQAIEYEIQWQINEIEEGRKIQQATVLFDPDKGETRAMRSKEDAQDYRYFPDPDLLPLEIKPEWIAEVKTDMPELPEAMKIRFETDYCLSEYDATTLTASLDIAHYFESCVIATGLSAVPSPVETGDSSEPFVAKLCANWVMNDVAFYLNELEYSFSKCPVSPEHLARLVCRVADNTISNKAAKEIFRALTEELAPDAVIAKMLGKPKLYSDLGPNLIDLIIEAKGLRQITDADAIEKIIDEVLAANPKSVEEFRAGKDKAFNALVGQAMKATKGKGNPQQVNDLLRKKLAA